MQINFVKPNKAFPNGYIEIDDARIIWKNFTGRGDRFNREGDRNFHLVIPTQEDCELLQNDKNKYGDGWNVKIKPPREEGDAPFMHMLVKVKYKDGRGPNVYLVSGNKQVPLNEDTISCLDDIDIVSVNMDIRPYDDELPNGSHFRTAYLSAMRVYQRVDRFASEDGYLDC
jgi:hypothetical protein